MLRKRLSLFTAIILFSLTMTPAGTALASTAGNTNNYEPDNGPGQAKFITSGAPQARSIVPQTDVDWVKFQLTATSGVLLETTGPLPSDTRISLFNSSLIPIEYNDDDGSGFYSYIDRLCSTDPLPAGTYYVKVEEYLNNAQIQAYNLALDASPCPAELVDIYTGTTRQGSSLLKLHQTVGRSFSSLNNGPVKISNTGPTSIMASERVIYKINGVNTSFSEMMALPNSQLDTTYWLPWYNNVNLDTQLRIANVSSSTATVTITIGGQQMGNPIQLAAGASTRQSFAGVDNGPVRITSNQAIVAAERVIYKVNGVNTSFTEMMALPNSQVDTTFWLPWYNNINLDTQLRLANTTNNPATVTVTIGGTAMAPINLAAGQSTRVSYTGVDNGPVKIVSTENIVAAERVIYKVNNVHTSFTEMMALPNNQLSSTYWMPWYNNTGNLDTQLRFANLGGAPATVHVYIGGAEMPNSPFNLAVGASTRQSFANVNKGPVQIVSNQNIVAAARLIYKVNNVPTSFAEMMGLPNQQLDLIHWLPWYNNVDLDTQLRIGLP